MSTKKRGVGLHHKGFPRQNRIGVQPRPKRSGKFRKSGAKCESRVSGAIAASLRQPHSLAVAGDLGESLFCKPDRLRAAMPNGSLKPHFSFGVVLRHALAVGVAKADADHRLPAARRRSLGIPRQRLVADCSQAGGGYTTYLSLSMNQNANAADAAATLRLRFILAARCSLCHISLLTSSSDGWQLCV